MSRSGLPRPDRGPSGPGRDRGGGGNRSSGKRPGEGNAGDRPAPRRVDRCRPAPRRVDRCQHSDPRAGQEHRQRPDLGGRSRRRMPLPWGLPGTAACGWPERIARARRRKRDARPICPPLSPPSTRTASCWSPTTAAAPSAKCPAASPATTSTGEPFSGPATTWWW